MPATATDPGDLTKVQAEIKDKVAEVRELHASRDDAIAKFRAAGIDGGAKMKDAPEFKAANDAEDAFRAASDELAGLRDVERTLLAFLSPSDVDLVGPTDGGARRDLWSVEALESSPEFRHLASHANSKAKFGQVTLFAADPNSQEEREETARLLATGQIAGRYLAAPIDSTGVTNAVPTDRRGYLAPLLRQLRFSDLVPMGTTNSNAIDYIQMTTAPGQAAETAEGTAKPEASWVSTPATAPVRTIAEWKKIARQTADDAPALMTFIKQLIAFDVRRRLDSQMLAGDGTGVNLRGILNTAGIGAPAFVAGDDAIMAAQRAITAVWAAEGQPTFIAVNPTVMQAIRFVKTTAGEYVYDAPGDVSVTGPTLWGIPLIVSTAVPATAVLVGDSTQATCLVREGITVRVADQDQDDFIKNLVTVLVEMRAAFLVWRPSAFAKGSLA